MTRQNRSVRLANCLRLALWQQDRRGCCACRLPPLAGSSLRHGGHTRRAARGRAAGRRGRAARARWRARGRWRQSRRRARGPDRRATPGARSPAGAAPPRSGRSPSWSAGARLRGPRVQGRVSLAHPAHVSKVSTAARQAAGSRLLREPLARAGLQAGGRRAAPGLRPAHCRPAGSWAAGQRAAACSDWRAHSAGRAARAARGAAAGAPAGSYKACGQTGRGRTGHGERRRFAAQRRGRGGRRRGGAPRGPPRAAAAVRAGVTAQPRLHVSRALRAARSPARRQHCSSSGRGHHEAARARKAPHSTHNIARLRAASDAARASAPGDCAPPDDARGGGGGGRPGAACLRSAGGGAGADPSMPSTCSVVSSSCARRGTG